MFPRFSNILRPFNFLENILMYYIILVTKSKIATLLIWEWPQTPVAYSQVTPTSTP